MAVSCFTGIQLVFNVMPAAFAELEIPPEYAMLFYLSLFICGFMFLVCAFLFLSLFAEICLGFFFFGMCCAFYSDTCKMKEENCKKKFLSLIVSII